MFEILHPGLLHVTVPPAELCQGEVDNLLVHLYWHGASLTLTSRIRWCCRCCYIRLGHTVCYTTSFIHWRSHTVIFREHTSQWPPQHTPQWPSNPFRLNTISSSHLGSFFHAYPAGCAARWPGWPRWPPWLAYWRLRTVIELFLKLVQ